MCQCARSNIKAGFLSPEMPHYKAWQESPTFTYTIKDLSEQQHHVNQVDEMKDLGVMSDEKLKFGCGCCYVM